MQVALVPYLWQTQSDGVPLEGWHFPVGVDTAIDLRGEGQSAKGATGYAIATTANEVKLPDGAVLLGADDNGLDSILATALVRDAIRDKTGYRPSGSTLTDCLWDMLLAGADDKAADRCRPLRLLKGLDLELHFGGQVKSQKLTRGSRFTRDQLAFAKADLDRIRDQVQAGNLPADKHRQVLQAMADSLGVDAASLKPAKWSASENAMKPATTITEGFGGGFGSWTSIAGTWTTSGGRGHVTGSNATNLWIKHNTALSSADHYAQIAFTDTATTGCNMGITCRRHASAETLYLVFNNGLVADGGGGAAYMYKGVAGSFTQLSTTLSGIGSQTDVNRRLDCTGSTITMRNLSTVVKTATDTSITGNLIVGMYGYVIGGSERYFDDFTATDGIPDTPTLSMDNCFSTQRYTGVPFNVTCRVLNATPLPTGTVTVKDGASTIGTGSLSLTSGGAYDGYAEAVVSVTLAAGDHSLTFVYAGDSNYSSGTSGVAREGTVIAVPAGATRQNRLKLGLGMGL